MHQSVLVYQRYRYLKLSLFAVLVCIIAYAAHNPVDKPNGGTWLGYVLGIVGALLILWLMWFGVRKRSYRSSRGTVEGWLSAHVYLGLSLLIIATLHTGFHFGWNVHTLAYALMVAVIVSGFYGVVVYLRYPDVMTSNIGEETQDSMLQKIADLDRECRKTAMNLSDEINSLILNASENTSVGGGVLRQLSGSDPACPTTAAVVRLQELGKHLTGADARLNHQLLTMMMKKKDLLASARRDVQYKALLNIWLYFHIPLSFGLLAALIAHVISVFFYW